MDGSTPDPTHPPSRQQAAVGGSRASSKATHQLWKQVNVHTQTPPRSATGQFPAFHLTALPRVRRLSRWSLLYGVWVPGSCPAVSLAPVDHLTRLCDSVRPASSQVQGHPPHSSEGSWCPCLVRESLSYWRRTWWNRSLQPIWRQGFSALTSLCPRKAVGYDQSWVCASWTGPFINLLSRCSCRSASSGASVTEIGLQRSTWRTRTSMCRSLVLSHLSRLGLRVNWEKSKLSLMQRISFLGMELDSVNQTVRLTQERAQSVLNCLNTFKNRMAAPLKPFQRLLGHMAAAMTPLGLLHMRPLQHWLHGRVPRWAWQSGTLRVQVTPACRQTFTPWSDLSFLRGRSAPGTGLQARCGLHGCLCQGLGGHVQRACSVGGLDGSPTALAHQLPRVAGSTPGLELSQETLTRRARTGPYRQHCNHRVHQPTRWSTLPSHVATCPPPPPLESEASEVASRHSYSGLAQPDSRRDVPSCAPRRVETPSPDGPADLETFRTHTGRPVRIPRDVSLPVVLLPDRRNTWHGRTGTQLAAGPSQVCIFLSEPSRTYTVQDQGGRGADPARGAILAHPDLVPRADAPRADAPPGRFLGGRIYWLRDGAPASRPLEPSCLVPGRDVEVLGDLPQEVVDTITLARAPSTRHAYALKWNLFVEWCSFHREAPRRCPIRVVLSFLQQELERRLSPSTLKVFVAAIAANHLTKVPYGGKKAESSTPPLYTLLGPVSSAQSTTAGPVQAFADSRAKVPLNENSAPACTGLH